MRTLTLMAVLAACSTPRPADNCTVQDEVGDDFDANCDGIDGVDADGDGVASADSGGLDCDDLNKNSLGQDADNDGFPSCVDCNDADVTAFPGAEEFCDGQDNACDGTVDRGEDGVGLCSVSQSGTRAVDLLFVVDTSCSMFEEQPQIASVGSTFMDTIIATGSDYHVGVVSTDMHDAVHQGKLRQAGGVRWVDDQTPNPSQVFGSMIEMGTGGSSPAKGRDALYAAMESHAGPGGYNEGFLRESAALNVVFISDSDDESTSIDLDELEPYLSTLKLDPQGVTVDAFVSVGQVCPTATDAGNDYTWLVDSFGGLATSVCDADWLPALDVIAERHLPGPFDLVLLPEAAAADSLAARVEFPGEAPTDYSAAQLTLTDGGTAVQLPLPVPEGSLVTIFYAPL